MHMIYWHYEMWVIELRRWAFRKLAGDRAVVMNCTVEGTIVLRKDQDWQFDNAYFPNVSYKPAPVRVDAVAARHRGKVV